MTFIEKSFFKPNRYQRPTAHTKLAHRVCSPRSGDQVAERNSRTRRAPQAMIQFFVASLVRKVGVWHFR